MNNIPPEAKARTLMLDQIRNNVQHLKPAVLRRLTKQTYKLYSAFLKDLTTEERKAFTPIYDHLVDTWLTFYREEERRRLQTAERKDKGEVLFTTFFPRTSSWERQKFITRTPNRQLAGRAYSEEIDVQVVRPDDWLADFKKAQVAA